MVRPCTQKATAIDRVKRKIQKFVRPSRIPETGFVWTVVPVSNGIELQTLNGSLGFVLASDIEGQCLGLSEDFKNRMRCFWSI